MICQINLHYLDYLSDHLHRENRLGAIQYLLSNYLCFNNTSRERLYQELGLRLIKDKLWHRKYVFFYKIIKGDLP